MLLEKIKLLQPHCFRPRISICKFGKSQARTLSRARIAECPQRQNVKRFFDAIEKEPVSDQDRNQTAGVHFKQHDLLKDPYNGPFDVIVCRNVTIYFKSDARDAVYQNSVMHWSQGAFCLWSDRNDQFRGTIPVSKKIDSFIYPKV